MTHMHFSAGAEGRISYGHLGRTNLSYLLIVFDSDRQSVKLDWEIYNANEPENNLCCTSRVVRVMAIWQSGSH